MSLNLEPDASALRRHRRCMHVPLAATPDGAGTRSAATGHVVGRVYFSPRHSMHYLVKSKATIWELAPERAVTVLWENGSTMVTENLHPEDPVCTG